MSVLFGGLLAFGCLASCGDEEPEVLKPQSATVAYVVNLGQDLMDAAAVTIYYIDANGQQAQETVTAPQWTKTVTLTTLPVKVGFSVQPRVKGTPTAAEYAIEADGRMGITLYDQEGGLHGRPFAGNLKTVKGQLGSDFLGQYLTRIGMTLSDAKAIGADGSITDTTITWGGNDDSEAPTPN